MSMIPGMRGMQAPPGMAGAPGMVPGMNPAAMQQVMMQQILMQQQQQQMAMQQQMMLQQQAAAQKRNAQMGGYGHPGQHVAAPQQKKRRWVLARWCVGLLVITYVMLCGHLRQHVAAPQRKKHNAAPLLNNCQHSCQDVTDTFLVWLQNNPQVQAWRRGRVRQGRHGLERQHATLLLFLSRCY